MNRGSLAYRVDDLLVRLASMRPRFMNRGSPSITARHVRTGAGFNEAPIHESGK